MLGFLDENTLSSTCGLEGSTFSYMCIINDRLGVGSTIWTGQAFKCGESSDQIRLTHSSHHDSGLGGEHKCGNFSAMIVGANGSEYISRLSFYGDSKLNQTTINCTLSGAVLVESIVVKLGGLL